MTVPVQTARYVKMLMLFVVRLLFMAAVRTAFGTENVLPVQEEVEILSAGMQHTLQVSFLIQHHASQALPWLFWISVSC